MSKATKKNGTPHGTLKPCSSKKRVSVQQLHIRGSREGEKRNLLEVNEHFRPTDNNGDGDVERLQKRPYNSENQSNTLIYCKDSAPGATKDLASAKQIPKNLKKLAVSLYRSQDEQDLFIDHLFKKEKGKQGVIWTKAQEKQSVEHLLEEFIEPLPAVLNTGLGCLNLPQSLQTIAALTKERDLPREEALTIKRNKNMLHDEGLFYQLDLSSLLCISAIEAISDIDIKKIVDVCAAPGGKSIYAYISKKPYEIICNEVIGKRHGMLHANLKRCGIENAFRTMLDPSRLSEAHKKSAELVLVDAPCSGQSLVSKDKKTFGAFHPSLINMNANRQKRILAYSGESTASFGYVLYSTCTYSREENEEVIDWFLKKFEHFTTVPVPHLKSLQSAYTNKDCYRIMPHYGIGKGGFVCLLKNQENST
jgi:16S rRNA C967 or C1407 C5-methylase (RsmB/RsmF family)